MELQSSEANIDIMAGSPLTIPSQEKEYLITVNKSEPTESKQKQILNDILAAVNVSLVNLPMCMAFASAAKLKPTIGITSAFFSSLFMFLSDAKVGVISVAMSTALLTKPIVETFGEDGYRLSLFLAGLFIMAFNLTKAYRYLIIIPRCVIDGFLTGCVFGVFKEQMPTIFGMRLPEAIPTNSDLFNLYNSAYYIFANKVEINWFSVLIYLSLSFLLLGLLLALPGKPWVLFLCLFGIFLGYFQTQMIPEKLRLETISEKYPGLELSFFSWPNEGFRTMKNCLGSIQFYMDSLSMSVVAIIESMITWGHITSKTDQVFLSKTKNLFAIGTCNLSGVVTGSLGSAFVYARTMLNHQSDARTQLSGVLNGVFCLMIGFLFFRLFSLMPSVVLEALLMGLELRTVNVKAFYHSFQHDFKHFSISMLVIIAMLFTRASNAIFLGFFFYLILFAKDLMNPISEKFNNDTVRAKNSRADSMDKSCKFFLKRVRAEKCRSEEA